MKEIEKYHLHQIYGAQNTHQTHWHRKINPIGTIGEIYGASTIMTATLSANTYPGSRSEASGTNPTRPLESPDHFMAIEHRNPAESASDHKVVQLIRPSEHEQELEE